MRNRETEPITVRFDREHPYFPISNIIADSYAPLIGCHGIAVYCALSRHAYRGTGQCEKSMSTIAETSGCGTTTVREAIDLLVICGLLHVEDRGHIRKANIYTILDVVAPTEALIERVRAAKASRGEQRRVRAAKAMGPRGGGEQESLINTDSQDEYIPLTDTTFAEDAVCDDEETSGTEGTKGTSGTFSDLLMDVSEPFLRKAADQSRAPGGYPATLVPVAVRAPAAAVRSVRRKGPPPDPRVEEFTRRYREKVGAGYDQLWPEVVRLFASECNPEVDEAWTAFLAWYCSRSDEDRQKWGVRVRTWAAGGRAADAIVSRRRVLAEPETGISKRETEKQALIRQFEAEDARESAERGGRFDRLEV